MAFAPSRLALVVAALGLALLGSACSDDKPKTKEASAAELVQAGLAAVGKGDEEAALSAFEEAADKDPRNFFAYYNIGTIYQQRGDDERALQAYGLALQANPSYVPALFNSAVIYGTTNPQLAITTYRKIIKIQPKAPTAYLNLGLLEAQLGLFEQAGKDLAKALQQDPSLVESIPKDVFKNSPAPSPAPTRS